MTNSVHVHYRDSGILGADPLQLVQLLYRKAIACIAEARGHVRERSVRERSKAIMRAWEIVNELRQSLDRSAGGEISRNLAALYAYMQTRLLEANSQQAEPPWPKWRSFSRPCSKDGRTPRPNYLLKYRSPTAQLQNTNRSVALIKFRAAPVPAPAVRSDITFRDFTKFCTPDQTKAGYGLCKAGLGRIIRHSPADARPCCR